MSSNSTSTSGVSQAQEVGYHSLPAAIVFAILYVPLLVWFSSQAWRYRTYVRKVLAFFCFIRIVAFIIRAVIIGSPSAGRNDGLYTADHILINVGFFGLVYCAYILVLERELLCDQPPPDDFIVRLTQNRGLFNLAITATIVLGITAYSMAGAHDTNSTANNLRKASTIIILALCALQAFQTLILAKMEFADERHYQLESNAFGVKRGIYILLFVSLLLLIRQAFMVATIRKPEVQNNEHLFYPLAALPEILAVILYTIPGLIPEKQEIQP